METTKPLLTLDTVVKVLHEDGRAYHGGTGRWHLPRGTRPGKWMPRLDGTIVVCEHGYHLTTLRHALTWRGPALYVAEPRGQRVYEHGEDSATATKFAVAQARLIRRVETWRDDTLRLFAADCADRVLSLFEREYPNDRRPREAIAAARAYARGTVTVDVLNALAAA